MARNIIFDPEFFFRELRNVMTLPEHFFNNTAGNIITNPQTNIHIHDEVIIDVPRHIMHTRDTYVTLVQIDTETLPPNNAGDEWIFPVRRTAEFIPNIARPLLVDQLVDENDILAVFTDNDIRRNIFGPTNAEYTKKFIYNIKKDNSFANEYQIICADNSIYTNIRYGKYECIFDYIALYFDDFTAIKNDDLFIASGFITNQFINEIYKKDYKAFDDIDIFCNKEIWNLLKEKHKNECKFTAFKDVFQFKLILTDFDEDIVIQFINKDKLTIERTLDSFDLNYCRVAYSNEEMIYIDKSLLSEEFSILKGDNPLKK